jgi:hypothetical protein
LVLRQVCDQGQQSGLRFAFFFTSSTRSLSASAILTVREGQCSEFSNGNSISSARMTGMQPTIMAWYARCEVVHPTPPVSEWGRLIGNTLTDPFASGEVGVPVSMATSRAGTGRTRSGASPGTGTVRLSMPRLCSGSPKVWSVLQTVWGVGNRVELGFAESICLQACDPRRIVSS